MSETGNFQSDGYTGMRTDSLSLSFTQIGVDDGVLYTRNELENESVSYLESGSVESAP